MAFENRAEAGRLLARQLDQYRGRRPLVLTIPRGAVPMGKIVADLLGELDVVLVRKLRAPDNPELAIGSIDETGAVYLDPDTRDLWDETYLKSEKAAQLATLHRRRQQYEPAGAVIDAAGRIAIVLDDGVATGSTMIAALRAVRARHPAKLIDVGYRLSLPRLSAGIGRRCRRDAPGGETAARAKRHEWLKSMVVIDGARQSEIGTIRGAREPAGTSR